MVCTFTSWAKANAFCHSVPTALKMVAWSAGVTGQGHRLACPDWMGCPKQSNSYIAAAPKG
jgi:hypothetical protein